MYIIYVHGEESSENHPEPQTHPMLVHVSHTLRFQTKVYVVTSHQTEMPMDRRDNGSKGVHVFRLV